MNQGVPLTPAQDTATAASGTLALLHTSPAHIPVFDALRDRDHPGLALRHHVDADLLTRARESGTAAVARDVERAVAAAARGAGAVLCTCSTIGGLAEAAGDTGHAAGRSVLRVDRPMAAAAVASGPRIAVVAALASTLEPTAALIAEEAARIARPVTVRTASAADAWSRFEAGDTDGYAHAVAARVDAVTGADVIVLAQASMAPAARLAATRTPVLSSPALGLAAAARACRG